MLIEFGAFLDRLLPVWLPQHGRLVAWAFFAALASESIYRLLAPHRRLENLEGQSRQARRVLANYDGDPQGLKPLVADALSVAMRHFALALAPTLAGALPVIAAAVTLDDIYPAGHSEWEWLLSWPLTFFLALVVFTLSLKALARRRRLR